MTTFYCSHSLNGLPHSCLEGLEVKSVDNQSIRLTGLVNVDNIKRMMNLADFVTPIYLTDLDDEKFVHLYRGKLDSICNEGEAKSNTLLYTCSLKVIKIGNVGLVAGQKVHLFLKEMPAQAEAPE